jgi:hypothetical protein
MYFVSYDPRFEIRPLYILPINREEIKAELEEYEAGLFKFLDKLDKYETQITDTF